MNKLRRVEASERTSGVEVAGLCVYASRSGSSEQESGIIVIVVIRTVLMV